MQPRGGRGGERGGGVGWLDLQIHGHRELEARPCMHARRDQVGVPQYREETQEGLSPPEKSKVRMKNAKQNLLKRTCQS